MGLVSKFLLFAFFKISVIHGGNLCPVSFCGNSTLNINYPFKLETQTLPNDCTYFNLSCNKTQGTAILNFRFSGDFYVQNIDYVGRNIQIYDPGNCLIKRLMIFSLSSSPFKANYYENYTLYACPLDYYLWAFHFNPIDCLSNSTSFVMATRGSSREFLETSGCRSFGSWLIPVSWPAQFESYNGLYDNHFLFLTWNATVCKECEESENLNTGKSGEQRMTGIVAIALSMPALIIIALTCCSVFCLSLMRMTIDKRNTDAEAAEASAPTTTATPPTTIASTMPPPPATSNSGLDESKIIACTETIILSESASNIPSANINTCSICLDIYSEDETLRLISKCRHCFHTYCIEQWLGKNSTCPVCRTSLSDFAL